MAVDKFLKRIVAPDLDDDKYRGEEGQIATHLHDYTHGINSDPLTIFAIVFSALIHDVDHRGVSNNQLIKEEEQMACLYRNKSVAEQNSVDIAWDLLMRPDFVELRECLFPTGDDLRRFRQVVVNVVLATDIFDKELNDLRKARWSKAFAENSNGKTKEFNDLRATIVIEHIIQASDGTAKGWRDIVTLSINFCCSFLRLLFWLQSLTRCSTGTCIENGTNVFLRKCAKPIVKVAWESTRPLFGTRERSDSLITISSRLPKN